MNYSAPIALNKSKHASPSRFVLWQSEYYCGPSFIMMVSFIKYICVVSGFIMMMSFQICVVSGFIMMMSFKSA